MESIGKYLRKRREGRAMSVEEIARATRIPIPSLERLESDRFDDLPGEVFVRGFLRSYARAVGLPVDDVMARYSASRRVTQVTPIPVMSPIQKASKKRFGVAVAFVVLLVLFTLALSIVLKPRGRDLPLEISLAPTLEQPVEGRSPGVEGTMPQVGVTGPIFGVTLSG
ncbi:MAG: helix-turn-helix domain-containing protein [Myxococcales bacterium]|nr:MAG: helix-turn-helix domain-containing protein [Myxococcales bacterium]